MNSRKKYSISFFFLLFFSIGLLHAQQPYTEYWFSFGYNYNPIPNDTIITDPCLATIFTSHPFIMPKELFALYILETLYIFPYNPVTFSPTL